MKESPLMQPVKKDFKYYFGIFGEALIILGMYILPIAYFLFAVYGFYTFVRYGIK